MKRLLYLLPAAAVIVMLAFLLNAGIEARTQPQTSAALVPAYPTLTPTHRTPTPFQPLPTRTLTFTPTITATPTGTPTVTETSTITPTATALPASYSIEGFVGHSMRYSLDCEARSAVDLAGFFGIKINEDEFLKKLPKSDNPEKGFVGSYAGVPSLPPASYGVHPPPVAALLRKYHLNAEAKDGMTYEELQAEIAANRPVMVWVVGGVVKGYPVSYTSSDGETTTVAYLEHTVVVIGYSPSGVTVQDGAYYYYRSKSTFMKSWKVLGYRAIVVSP